MADTISRAIYTGEKNDTEIAELLSELREDESLTVETDKNDPVEKEKKVGIFTLRQEGDEEVYVRDEKYKSEFYNWVKNVDRITAKSTKEKRVVLFGESVARGWFYEPYYSPASVLESIVEKSRETEVVDLAVTSMNMQELLELCEEATVLEANTYVIFAGNNWKYDIINRLEPFEAFEVYKEVASGKPDYEKVNAIIHTAYNRVMDFFFKQLHEITAKNNTEVLFIMPEFNLMDFRSSELEKGMYMPNEATAEWVNVKSKGEEALQEANFVELENLAKQLVELNPFHPVGYEWLADIELKNGNASQAKAYLRKACDTGIYRAASGSSRVYSGYFDPIARNCEQYGFSLVRMDELFDAHLEGGIADRKLFMDYCHLTVDGIELVMKACAKKLLNVWESEKIDEVDNFKITVDKKVAAIAHLLAALHNNLGGQGFDIIDYHCRKAVENDSEIVDKLKSLLMMSIGGNRWKMNKESISFVENNLLEMGMFHYENHARINSPITQSIRNILNENGFENDYDKELTQGYKSSERIDLLDKAYTVDTTQFMKQFMFLEKAFYSEINHQTAFSFYALKEENEKLRLKITSRVPDYSNFEDITIVLNGKELTRIKSSEKWYTVDVDIPADQLNNGLNELSVEWPLILTNPQEGVMMTTSADLKNAISPVLGELYNLEIEKRISFSF